MKMIKIINEKYDFNTIEHTITLKIAIIFEFEIVEKQGFKSGKLLNTKLDKFNKLIFYS